MMTSHVSKIGSHSTSGSSQGQLLSYSLKPAVQKGQGYPQVYLKADEAMEQEITRRAIAEPKPMYYRDVFFDAQVATYLDERELSRADEMDPDHFVRWVFPRLMAYRRPLYQAIADVHGYVVDAKESEAVRSEADFLEMVANAIGD